MDPDQGFTLVLPMAGLGTRFRKAGITTPKPLIRVEGATIIEWSLWAVLSSVPIQSVVFGVREEALGGLRDIIAQHEIKATIVLLDEPTDGAATTVARCIEAAAMVGGEPLIAADCDSVTLLAARVELPSAAGIPSGFLSVAPATDPAFSYVTMEGTDVKTVVEKQRASSLAITGMYGFPSATAFLNAYAVSRNSRETDEHFLSATVRAAISQGVRFGTRAAKVHLSLGTPADVRESAPRLRYLPTPRQLGTLLV